MLTCHAEMMEGCSIEPKKKLVAKITRASVEFLGSAPESVGEMVTEMRSTRLIGEKQG
jgi:4-oxalocrotonate tautomerase